MQTRNPSPAQTGARRQNSRQSTGPRSCRGKRHSRRNALKHGLYSDVQYFCQEAAVELGEDRGQFRRLYLGLLEARRPGQYDPSGGVPAPTTPAAEVGAVREPPLPEPEGSLEPTGVAHTSRRVWSGCMRRSPQTGQERDADMAEGGTSAPPPESTIPPRPLGGEGSGGEGVLVAAPGQPQGLPLCPAKKSQNRGNEAKNSLKTKEVTKTMRAKPTHSCARNASKEAKERGFRCNVRRSVGRIQARVGVAKARAPYFMGRGESIHDRLWRRRTS
jgi:hypothetical protein